MPTRPEDPTSRVDAESPTVPCGRGCAVAAWSMPTPLGDDWRCRCGEPVDAATGVDLTRLDEQPRAAVGLLGTGSYVPAYAVSNDEVGARAGVDDRWIRQKTGISSRRWAKPDEATSDLAVVAGRAALRQAGIPAEALSMLIVATSTPDSPQPPTACTVADQLGAATTIAAFDLNAVCSGFVYAIAVAQRSMRMPGEYALVIGADVYSRILDPTDRRTAVLFGDGAGAAVLGPVPAGWGILATRLLTFGAARDLIGVPAGGSRLPASAETLAGGKHHFTMAGRAVRAFVAERVPPAVHELLVCAGIAAEEVSHVVPHQASGVVLADLVHGLKLPRARTHTTLPEYGNSGAASVGVTLDAAVRSGAIRPGDLVLLAGFGGGMAVGLALLRWC